MKFSMSLQRALSPRVAAGPTTRAASATLLAYRSCAAPARSVQHVKPRSMSITATSRDLLFRQLFDAESSTYTYILADPATKEGVIIDSVLEQVGRDVELLQELGVNLLYALDTHCHADHITGAAAIKARLPDTKSVISAASGAAADVKLQDGDVISFGSLQLRAVATPGHTNGCMSFYTTSGAGMVFTGDALLIRGCGRTDFQEGDAGTLYDKVHSQLFTLPGDTLVYPAHDYKGRTASSVVEEKTLNPRLTKVREDFITLMNNLGLPYPKKIDVALPANLKGGLVEAPAKEG